MKEKEFDKIIGELVKKDDLENPSVNFLPKLMEQISYSTIVVKQKKTNRVIEPKGWIVPVLFFISILILTILTTSESGNSNFDLFDALPKLNIRPIELNLNFLQKFDFSSLLFYGSVFGAGIFILTFLDQYFHNRKMQ